MITEWNDKANRTSFFKSSSIYWITKQCFWALFSVKASFLVLYSIYCLRSLDIFFLWIISSSRDSWVPIISSYSVSSISRMQFPQATLIWDSELISPPYFFASFNSTTPNETAWHPPEISIKIGFIGFWSGSLVSGSRHYRPF